MSVANGACGPCRSLGPLVAGVPGARHAPTPYQGAHGPSCLHITGVPVRRQSPASRLLPPWVITAGTGLCSQTRGTPAVLVFQMHPQQRMYLCPCQRRSSWWRLQSSALRVSLLVLCATPRHLLPVVCCLPCLASWLCLLPHATHAQIPLYVTRSRCMDCMHIRVLGLAEDVFADGHVPIRATVMLTFNTLPQPRFPMGWGALLTSVMQRAAREAEHNKSDARDP